MCDIKETRHLWYLKNRERIIEHQKTYRKDKIKNDLGLTNINMQNKLIRMSNNDSIVEYLNKYV